jgi:hypothetical protein
MDGFASASAFLETRGVEGPLAAVRAAAGGPSNGSSFLADGSFDVATLIAANHASTRDDIIGP